RRLLDAPLLPDPALAAAHYAHVRPQSGPLARASDLGGIAYGFAPLALREAPLPERGIELVRAARYTGYRRLLDRMAVGVATTLEQMDTDPGAALVSYVGYLTRIAGRIKRQQNRRAKAWRKAEHDAATIGQPFPLVPDVRNGLGARLDTPTRADKRKLLLD